MLQPQPRLRVETRTWHRDSHDLFDYEATSCYAQRIFVSKSGKLFRVASAVSYLDEEEEFPASADFLISIKCQPDGTYLIIPADRSNGRPNCRLTPKKMFLRVGHLPENQYILSENLSLKLGRLKLRVRQILRTEDQVMNFTSVCAPVPVNLAQNEESNIKQCRICLLEGNHADDPLIDPCKCKGSIKYIHLECLRRWIGGRQSFVDIDKGVIFLKQVQCELCKTYFPFSIRILEEELKLVDIPTLAPPLIILEQVGMPHGRGLHFISMANKSCQKLGRGHGADIRISDVSISRIHATITYSEGCFRLTDERAKFGTLVAWRKAILIRPLETTSVQVGRSLLSIQIDNPPPLYQFPQKVANEQNVNIMSRECVKFRPYSPFHMPSNSMQQLSASFNNYIDLKSPSAMVSKPVMPSLRHGSTFPNPTISTCGTDLEPVQYGCANETTIQNTHFHSNLQSSDVLPNHASTASNMVRLTGPQLNQPPLSSNEGSSSPLLSNSLDFPLSRSVQRMPFEDTVAAEPASRPAQNVTFVNAPMSNMQNTNEAHFHPHDRLNFRWDCNVAPSVQTSNLVNDCQSLLDFTSLFKASQNASNAQNHGGYTQIPMSFPLQSNVSMETGDVEPTFASNVSRFGDILHTQSNGNPAVSINTLAYQHASYTQSSYNCSSPKSILFFANPIWIDHHKFNTFGLNAQQTSPHSFFQAPSIPFLQTANVEHSTPSGGDIGISPGVDMDLEPPLRISGSSFSTPADNAQCSESSNTLQ